MDRPVLLEIAADSSAFSLRHQDRTERSALSCRLPAWLLVPPELAFLFFCALCTSAFRLLCVLLFLYSCSIPALFLLIPAAFIIFRRDETGRQRQIQIEPYLPDRNRRLEDRGSSGKKPRLKSRFHALQVPDARRPAKRMIYERMLRLWAGFLRLQGLLLPRLRKL